MFGGMYPYPTEEQLEYIKNFDLVKQGYFNLLDYIYNIWSYPDYYILGENALELHTGGWSGNEDIVYALQENTLFWAMAWMKSERGGHYTFDLTRLPGFGKKK